MPDEEGPTTRRELLAALGATAATTTLAGCGNLPSPLGGGERTVTLDGGELRAIASGETPTVPERIPVAVEAAYVEAVTGRVRDLLSAVPTPFGRGEIPNGAIRERLTEVHGRAQESLAAVQTAESDAEALEAGRNARRNAGNLYAAWRSIDDGLTRRALLDEADSIHGAVKRFQRRWRYVGSDPVRTTLVTTVLERHVDRALSESSVSAERLQWERENPVTVGELGGELEIARALADDSAYLYGRYTDSLSEPADLEPALRAAAESLASTVRTRRRDIPRRDPSALVDRDIDETVAGWGLRTLHQRATYTSQVDDALERGHYATAVLGAHEGLVRIRAFESLRRRIEDGALVALEDADDVRTLRAAAIRTIERTLDGATHPRLARRPLSNCVALVESADRELGRLDEEIEATRIAREVSHYPVAEELAGGVPDATERVVAALAAAS